MDSHPFGYHFYEWVETSGLPVWGYVPSGIASVIPLVVLVLSLMGRP
jgi:hypothetical protein